MATSERIDSNYRRVACKATALTAELHSVGAARLDYHTIRQFSASIVILCEALRSLSHHPGATRPHRQDWNRTNIVYHEGTDLQSAVTPPIVTACL